MSSLVEKAKNAAIGVALTKALQYLDKDPETNIPKVMNLVDKVVPDGWYVSQRNAFRNVIEEKGNWYQLMLRVWELDPGVRKALEGDMQHIPAYVIKNEEGNPIHEINLHIAEMTDEEKEIVKAGCLINYNRNRHQ